MSLPPIIKHIYSRGTEEVIRRGKKIFLASGVQFMDVDHVMEQVRFRVKNDQYQNYYTVTATKYLHPESLNVRCNCPYNLGELCRHEVAALFQVHELVQAGFFEHAEVEYDQSHTVLRLRQVSKPMLQIYANADLIEDAHALARTRKVKVTATQTDSIEATVQEGKKTFTVTLRQNEERYFDTSCGCKEKKYPLCIHKAAVFIFIITTEGAEYFQSMRNWDQQKNMLLRQYGFSLNDNLKGKFDFVYQNGKPFLRVLDPSLKKKSELAPLPAVTSGTTTVTKGIAVNKADTLVTIEKEADDKKLGLALITGLKAFPYVEVSLIAGVPDAAEAHFISEVERISAADDSANAFPRPPEGLIVQARQFQPHLLINYLRRVLPFSELLDDKDLLKAKPDKNIQDAAWEFLLPRYKQILQTASKFHLTFLLTEGKPFSEKNLEPAGFSNATAKPEIEIKKDDENYILSLLWNIAGDVIPFEETTLLNTALLQHGAEVFALQSIPMLRIAEPFFPKGIITVKEPKWQATLRDKIIPWSQSINVRFDESIAITHLHETPFPSIFLSERERMLVIEIVFQYGAETVKWGTKGDPYFATDKGLFVLHRKEEIEEEFIQTMRIMHSDLKEHAKEHFFHLPSNAVLTNDWFFRFTDEMKLHNVTIHGIEALKTLRINMHKPETVLHVNNGLDWFDANVTIKFGEQTAGIDEIKKAIQQKQSYVRLSDGSLGILPEAWLRKYSLMLKVGEANGNNIRLKKYHFSVLDQLLADIDEEQLADELEDKKERLTDILSNDYATLDPPEQLTATLRPYQQAGYQWLKFLQDAGWGGILADDMGLGKTVQTLAHLQNYKNENEEAQFLVVCPTTLMYNWEAEIKKFTPELRHLIHHGTKRTSDPRDFTDYHVIITTYGTMRSDIKMFHAHAFDYAVLDESQAIKNPASQSAKASLLINAKHRIALSGTPLQNNTFDLYAQMNFLNPGMFGSREAFMTDFANPIDKNREAEVTQQLKQLTYPFMLRRTKEQVAKDLPEKTETILYCEMGKEQRSIYNAFRNDYRDKILGMIDEKGIGRSQMHILQGLTRLRQICDSPGLIGDENFPHHSIKLDEIVRELIENVGDHKALVFSQFLGMLALIRGKLEELNIPYAYFDGSTSSTGRVEAINKFQNDPANRVFLISLKAGGIGLNLTAADYVYIVDPWWNPAVEQQAIDRTHRIGQTKNIFAYRLICKNSIEEKMLELQERKKTLASELVGDDNAFFKRLTRDDIAYLLS